MFTHTLNRILGRDASTLTSVTNTAQGARTAPDPFNSAVSRLIDLSTRLDTAGNVNGRGTPGRHPAAPAEQAKQQLLRGISESRFEDWAPFLKEGTPGTQSPPTRQETARRLVAARIPNGILDALKCAPDNFPRKPTDRIAMDDDGNPIELRHLVDPRYFSGMMKPHIEEKHFDAIKQELQKTVEDLFSHYQRGINQETPQERRQPHLPAPLKGLSTTLRNTLTRQQARNNKALTLAFGTKPRMTASAVATREMEATGCIARIKGEPFQTLRAVRDLHPLVRDSSAMHSRTGNSLAHLCDALGLLAGFHNVDYQRLDASEASRDMLQRTITAKQHRYTSNPTAARGREIRRLQAIEILTRPVEIFTSTTDGRTSAATVALWTLDDPGNRIYRHPDMPLPDSLSRTLTQALKDARNVLRVLPQRDSPPPTLPELNVQPDFWKLGLDEFTLPGSQASSHVDTSPAPQAQDLAGNINKPLPPLPSGAQVLPHAGLPPSPQREQLAGDMNKPLPPLPE